jgi:microcystin-dependent protein
MADNFLAEIRMFPFNFAPKGWAFCNGQLLPISQNTAVFSLLGTFYGGDGRSNFALPNLQGNVPVGLGQGPGLSLYDIGETGGASTVSLVETELPEHTHGLFAVAVNGTSNSPSGHLPAMGMGASGRGHFTVNTYATAGSATSLSPTQIAIAGGGEPHNNMQSYVSLNFCIALQGIFPARS